MTSNREKSLFELSLKGYCCKDLLMTRHLKAFYKYRNVTYLLTK